jgi:hypothetical protein
VDRWPPHLNLLHPFVAAAEFGAAAAVLGEALAGLAPAQLRLTLAAFAHRDTSVAVWLVPDAPSLAALAPLLAAAADAFPDCRPPAPLPPAAAPRAAAPHLALGQFPSAAAAATFIALVRPRLDGLAVPVTAVHLLARAGPRSAGRVEYLRVGLGGPGGAGDRREALAEYAALRRVGPEVAAGSATHAVAKTAVQLCPCDSRSIARSRSQDRWRRR